MTVGEKNFYAKLHNELLTRLGIDSDKYAKGNAISRIIEDICNGEEEEKVFKEVFDTVYDVAVSDLIYKSCYENVKGFSGGKHVENVFEYVFVYETERGGRGIVRADDIAEAAERVRAYGGRAVTSIKRVSELDMDHGVIDVHFMWED